MCQALYELWITLPDQQDDFREISTLALSGIELTAVICYMIEMFPEQHALTPQTPRDRLLNFGPTALTTGELLAVVLGTGTTGEPAQVLADRLLAEHGNLIGLARLNLTELMELPGVGAAKAAQLQAVLDLGRRLTLEVAGERLLIRSPAEAAQHLMPDMMHLEQESLRVMLLNTRDCLIGIHEVYKGSLNSIVVRAADVFREAVRRNSAALILAHNHPSGDPSPSPEDVSFTRQMIMAGHLLSVDVLDHLIIGQGQFVSLKERGLGFE